MMKLVFVTTNQCGVLARVTSIISSVSANIQRCSVSTKADPSLSILTFQIQATEEQGKAIRRKALRLVEVLEATAYADEEQAPGENGLSLYGGLCEYGEQVA
ncbi:MAG: hypothetical protein U5J83_18555 [Bryobacterales bacterium]|nr:hypothetical protein [Bryobacterales bacterium]